jgi:hypothetical protein
MQTSLLDASVINSFICFVSICDHSAAKILSSRNQRYYPEATRVTVTCRIFSCYIWQHVRLIPCFLLLLIKGAVL